MKTGGTPGFESSFVPTGGKENERAADRFPIPNAARRRVHVPPDFIAKNLQIALIWFDPVGPTAEPLTGKFNKTTWIWFDRVGSPAECRLGKSDKTTWIRFDQVECTARTRHLPNVAEALAAWRPEPQSTAECRLGKSDKTTLNRFSQVGLTLVPSCVVPIAPWTSRRASAR